MTQITSIVFLPLLAVINLHAEENPLLGRWGADVRSKGGLGALLVFEDNGTVTSTFGALVDFNYKADGKMITMSFNDAPDKVTQPYQISGDKMVVEPAHPENREERTRVGAAKPGTNPIVGLWKFKHDTGAVATVQYTSGGTGQLSVPMTTETGQYKVHGKIVTLEFKGRAEPTFTLTLAGNHLTGAAEKDKPQRKFTRVDP
ncbi:MAG: hypothetical protein V4733_03035 [Verrucomicrobiota bacterium]